MEKKESRGGRFDVGVSVCLCVCVGGWHECVLRLFKFRQEQTHMQSGCRGKKKDGKTVSDPLLSSVHRTQTSSV